MITGFYVCIHSPDTASTVKGLLSKDEMKDGIVLNSLDSIRKDDEKPCPEQSRVTGISGKETDSVPGRCCPHAE